MKKIFALTLALMMLLSGCGSKAEAPAAEAAPTTEPVVETTAEPTTEPTTVPTTEPLPPPVNPLTGEILDAPYTGRVFANTISNVPAAIPHVGVTQADILMEMFVNNSVVRCLALYTDMAPVQDIGGTRSTRLMFNDIAQHYDLVLSHAGGSDFCLNDANDRGLDHFNIDSLMRQGDPVMKATARRYDEKPRSFENSLFGNGQGIMAYAESAGIRMTQPEDKDYGLNFTEDGTPANGETADKISIMLTYGKAKKETVMAYDASLGKYVYYQYDQMMVDQISEEVEAFENVIVMHANIDGVQYHQSTYQRADFLAGGTGYFACGGQLIPITWTCDSDTSPFRFFAEDGTPLELGVGNTYIAICTPESKVSWTSTATAEATA